MRRNALVLIAALWIAATPRPAPAEGTAESDLPSAAPAVSGIFPHGAPRGLTTEIELTGQNLHDTKSVDFAGKGVAAEIAGLPLGSSLKLRVTVAADAEVGRRDFRLITSRGAYVGVFDIGALPEIREVENNDDWRKPQPIAIPILVNGIIGNEDWDHFRVHAEAGETLIFDVSATRHGSRLDADLALLDERGSEIAWVDDTTIYGDPHLEHTFQKAGDFVIRVGSLAGGGNADYRLAIGKLPYVTRTFPAGLSAGRTTQLSLSGTNLDLVDEVWLGDRLAKGTIVHRDSKTLRAIFRLAANAPAGPYKIHASRKGMEVAIPTELRVSELPEITVSKAPGTLESALAITPSLVLNGVIDQSKATHYFRFEAKAGEKYMFRAESMKLGYHLDPALAVLDSGGAQVAYADDPGGDDRSDEYQLDPDMSYAVEKGGTYYVAIRDGMYRGGDQLLYRLTVRRMEPDFIVELRDPVKSLYQGQQSTLLVRIKRRAGWDTPVDVWAEGLPEGITASLQTAASKDSIVKDTCGVDRVIDGTIVMLPVRVSGQMQGHFPFTIKARGTMNGKVVEHEASMHYPRLSAGYTYGIMETQKAEVTVTLPPEVVVEPPAKVTIGPGKERKISLALGRFSEAARQDILIRIARAGQGVTSEQTPAPAGLRTASIVIKASATAATAPMVLEAVAPGGRVLGMSAPFLVEVKTEESKGR